MSDFRFQMSDLRTQVSGFRFQVSDFRFQISGFRFQVSDFRFQISGFRFQVSDLRFQISDLRLQNLILGMWGRGTAGPWPGEPGRAASGTSPLRYCIRTL